LPQPTAGSWRVDPVRSQASFAARAAGRPIVGHLPLTGRVLMAEPVEDSTVRLAARTSAISTGSPWLDRLLAGPGFLDAKAFPEIGFRSELLAWVPAGWRAVGRLPGQLHAVAPDRPGYGSSQLPAGGFAANARAVLDGLDSRGITRAVLVGHSYGGGVALLAASLAPGQVEAIVAFLAAAPITDVPIAQPAMT